MMNDCMEYIKVSKFKKDEEVNIIKDNYIISIIKPFFSDNVLIAFIALFPIR